MPAAAPLAPLPGHGDEPDAQTASTHLRPAAVPLALGETIELQDDADIVGQQRDLDPAAQTAQALCDYRLAQPVRGGAVTALLIEGDAHLASVAAHRLSSLVG